MLNTGELILTPLTGRSDFILKLCLPGAGQHGCSLVAGGCFVNFVIELSSG